MQFLVLFLLACGQKIEVEGVPAEVSSAALKELGEQIGEDVAGGLFGWIVHVHIETTFVPCGYATTAIGCTDALRNAAEAWTRLSMAPPMTWEQTALRHELLHVWLTAKTGDGDQAHTSPLWDRVGR